MAVCKDCEHYNVCLIHCSESVLRNRGICEHFKNGWISVKDRLPEDTQRVLFVPTCNQGSVYIGQFAFVGRDGGVMFAHREGRYKSNYYAKYWMPLPEAPKEDER